jgi:hypothetical protein
VDRIGSDANKDIGADGSKREREGFKDVERGGCVGAGRWEVGMGACMRESGDVAQCEGNEQQRAMSAEVRWYGESRQ